MSKFVWIKRGKQSIRMLRAELGKDCGIIHGTITCVRTDSWVLSYTHLSWLRNWRKLLLCYKVQINIITLKRNSTLRRFFSLCWKLYKMLSWRITGWSFCSRNRTPLHRCCWAGVWLYPWQGAGIRWPLGSLPTKLPLWVWDFYMRLSGKNLGWGLEKCFLAQVKSSIPTIRP